MFDNVPGYDPSRYSLLLRSLNSEFTTNSFANDAAASLLPLALAALEM